MVLLQTHNYPWRKTKIWKNVTGPVLNSSATKITRCLIVEYNSNYLDISGEKALRHVFVLLIDLNTYFNSSVFLSFSIFLLFLTDSLLIKWLRVFYFWWHEWLPKQFPAFTGERSCAYHVSLPFYKQTALWISYQCAPLPSVNERNIYHLFPQWLISIWIQMTVKDKWNRQV